MTPRTIAILGGAFFGVTRYGVDNGYRPLAARAARAGRVREWWY